MRWGIIGLGRHIETRIYPALKDAASEAPVTAVCSRDGAKAAAAARDLAGLGHAGVRAYTDYAAMLADPNVDAVYLVTPNDMHRAGVEAAARAGKHVLCEKPLALTAADGEAMIAACRAGGVRLGTGFHLRHHSAHRAARAALVAGEVGEIRLAEAHWPMDAPSRGGWWADPARVGANATLGLAVHALDLLLWLTGDTVTHVSAVTNGQRPEAPLEDMSLALLRFAGGGFGHVFGGRRVPRGLNDIVVYGARARLHGIGTIGTLPVGRVEITADTGTRVIEPVAIDLYRRQFVAFAEAVAAGHDPDASGEDGLAAIRITTAWLQSARKGREVAVAQP